MSTTRLILIVEDEPLVLEDAVEILSDGGFEVITASDGPTAIEAINARIEELAGIVTDVRVGNGPDGWEIAHRARELKPTVAVVYTTGHGALEWASEGVPRSVVLQKPYAAAQLLTAVSELLNKGDGILRS